jgi:hypothetical protein
MKYIWVFIWYIFFSLFSCTNGDRKVVKDIGNETIADSKDDISSYLYDDGRIKIRMNLYDSLPIILSIVDMESDFEVIIDFNENLTIRSFLIGGDISSNYFIVSQFFISEEHMLYRMEQFEDLIIIQEVFKDGRVEISTRSVN